MRENNLPDRLLSLFIFLCTIYILPWMLGFAGWYSGQPYRDIMFYIPFQQLLLIGPVIFLYTKSILNAAPVFKRQDLLHFLPAAIYLLYSLVIVITDKLVLKTYFFYADGRDKDLATWYQLAGIMSMTAYFLVSLRYYFLYKKLIVHLVSFADTLLFSWIKKYLLAFLLMQIARIIFFIAYPDWGNFPANWWYYIAFSSLYFYIAITGFGNHAKSIVSYRTDLFRQNPVYHLQTSNAGETETIEIIEPDALERIPAVEKNDGDWLQESKIKLLQLIEAERLYENPELSLPEVAEKMAINTSMASKIINQGFNMNFNDFINHYRTKAVIRKLEAGEQQTQTLMSIAMDCGFNSKSTFNRAFKKLTSCTPKEFLDQLPKN